jgi:hypothetical protein
MHPYWTGRPSIASDAGLTFTVLGVRRLFVGLLTYAIAAGAQAGVFTDGDDVLMIQGSPDVIHFDPSPEHTDHSWLIGIEWQAGNRWLAGWSHFNNSFDQRCDYIYVGKSWTLDSVSPNLYVKLTGGVVLGYKEPYEDKIPFNNDGVAPGIIPAIGYKYERFNAQVNLLGTAGLMITVGFDILN